jgi:hypothetical protein
MLNGLHSLAGPIVRSLLDAGLTMGHCEQQIGESGQSKVAIVARQGPSGEVLRCKEIVANVKDYMHRIMASYAAKGIGICQRSLLVTMDAYKEAHPIFRASGFSTSLTQELRPGEVSLPACVLACTKVPEPGAGGSTLDRMLKNTPIQELQRASMEELVEAKQLFDSGRGVRYVVPTPDTIAQRLKMPRVQILPQSIMPVIKARAGPFHSLSRADYLMVAASPLVERKVREDAWLIAGKSREARIVLASAAIKQAFTLVDQHNFKEACDRLRAERDEEARTRDMSMAALRASLGL